MILQNTIIEYNGGIREMSSLYFISISRENYHDGSCIIYSGRVLRYMSKIEKQIHRQRPFLVKSVGMVLFRMEQQKIVYLLLHHGGKYWNFPKGRQEEGETELETAFREVSEETGITQKHILLVPGFRESYIYRFRSPDIEEKGKIIVKRAIFYLGRCLIRKVILSHEHKKAGWFPYKEATERLFFKESRKVVNRAQSTIEKILEGSTFWSKK